MSVLVLGPKAMQYINNGLQKAAYNSVCDEYYSHTIRSHFRLKDIETESKRLIENWSRLNELSWCARYEGEKFEHLCKFIRHNEITRVSVYQLLKYIQCLIYNIEIETIEASEIHTLFLSEQDKQDYELLKNWEVSLMSAIIDQLPEYKKAQWCEEPEMVF